MDIIYLYSASLALTCVLWYLLKHTYTRNWTGEGVHYLLPYRVRRWQVILYTVLMAIPLVNVIAAIWALVHLWVDFETKIELKEKEE